MPYSQSDIYCLLTYGVLIPENTCIVYCFDQWEYRHYTDTLTVQYFLTDLCQFWGNYFSFTLKGYQLPKDTIKALSYHHGAQCRIEKGSCC